MLLSPTLNNLLLLFLVIFFLGVSGIYLNRKNLLVLLMSIELLLLAVNLIFTTITAYSDDLSGLIFTLIIITVAAAESAIGLAILVNLYSLRKTVNIQYINLMKG